jgi:hypothetical protein
MEETFFEPEEWVSMRKLDAHSRAEVLIAYIVKNHQIIMFKQRHLFFSLKALCFLTGTLGAVLRLVKTQSWLGVATGSDCLSLLFSAT